MGKRLTNKQIAAALKESRGFVSVAARTLGITRQTIYNRLKGSELLRAAREDAQELTKDIAELKLLEAINARESWAVCFYLKCQAKERGYVERSEVKSSVELSGGLDLSVEDAREELRSKLTAIASRLQGVGGASDPSGNGRRG